MLGFFIPHRLEGEKIILVVRRHPFVLLLKILLWVGVAIMPVIFYRLLGGVIAAMMPLEIFYPLLVLGGSLFYLYVWLFLVFSFVDYYLDVWIITNERIVNIEQKGLFARTLSEQKLFRVQDVTSEINGFFPVILNYGNVFIQTAGEKERFVFKEVPHPTQVCKKIIILAEQNRQFHHIAMET